MPLRPSAPSARAGATLSQVSTIGRPGVVLSAAAQNWWWALLATPDSSLFCGSAAGFSGPRRLVMSNWSVGVQSEVSEQPFSDEETLRGARNRVKNAMHMAEEADFVVAIEGGVEWCSFTEEPQLMCFAWAVVLSKDLEGKARTAAFMLPPPLAELIAGGAEMAEADDKYFKRKGSKSSNGTVGLLTGDHITRQAYYEHAMTMALIPFINPELFSSPSVPVLPAGSSTKLPEPT